jgi:hypothetical protein
MDIYESVIEDLSKKDRHLQPNVFFSGGWKEKQIVSL